MPRTGQPGFMLFELMLVVVIVIFCCGIGFLSYFSVKGTSFATDSALLSLLFHTAATRASCLKMEQKIVFDESSSTVIFDGNSYKLSDGYQFGVLPETYGPPSAPQKLVTQPITFVDKQLIAHTDGTLQAGTLYITDMHEQYALTTPVSAFSHIRVYRYRNKVWHKY